MAQMLVSVRGFIKYPVLVKIDLEKQLVLETIRFPELKLDYVPESKRGFSGLQVNDNVLYAATWDRICIIDLNTHRVIETITDTKFSDLHSLHVCHEGKIWVTSTNLDGVYCIDSGNVYPYWHAWQRNLGGGGVTPEDKDYRYLMKEDIPYHQCHVNSVHVDMTHLYATYLGPSLYPREMLPRLATKLRLKARYKRYGGIFIVQRKTSKRVAHIRTEGLHDLHEYKNRFLISTEYFGNAVRIVDKQDFSSKRIPLETSEANRGMDLTRGVHVVEDEIWVGTTIHRARMASDIGASIKSFDFEGKWTGKEIKLPGHPGVYDFVTIIGS